MADDPYTDDEYDDTYKKTHGDEPARDQYTDESSDDTFFPSGVGDTLSPSGWGVWPSNDATGDDYEETRGEYDEDARTASDADDESDDSWVDEELIGSFLLVGVILFLFPEPATSAIGIGMVTLGVVGWVVDQVV